MPLNAGNLAASLSLNLQPFLAGIKQSVQAVQGLGNQMSRSLGTGPQNSINQTSRAVQKLSSEFKDLDRIVSGILISQAFYAGLNAIQDSISAVMHFSNEMEKAQIALEYFLGTPERATGFIMQMKDLAADTAMSTEQAISLSRRLMGAQFRPEELRSVITILQDANAATGATAEQMDRIVLAMTQMKTNGRIMGSELRQFAEAGIPVYQLLREELGLTADQIANIGDLRISGDLGVSAILSGLQKRYQGAADRIADTVPGMWETIKDNTLFISEELFSGLYGDLKGFLTTWRDGIETAREIMTKSGLGGVFEHFVPENMQEPIRQIIASFKALGESIKNLYAAIKPMLDIMGQGVIQVLGAVLPPLAMMAQYVTNLVVSIVQANPWIKALGAAIIGLMVAQAAAKALMFLWSVTRLGVIAAAVANAVQLLARSIFLLNGIMAKNVVVRVIVLIAAALMALAATSKHAAAWLDQLMARFNALIGGGGFSTDDILKPVDNSDEMKWMDEFYEQVSGINDGLKDTGKGLEETGKESEKAGKKVKDKFVASFDELYQIPDMLDKVNDGLDGGGLDDVTMPEMPDMPKLPGMPEMPEMPKIDDSLKDADFGLPYALENLKRIITNFEWPNFPPPNFAVVTDMLETINLRLQNLKLALTPIGVAITDLLTNVSTSLQAWVTGSLGSLANWATLANNVFVTWGANALGSLSAWMEGTKNALITWSAEALGILGDFMADPIGSLDTWAQAGIVAIGDWVAQTLGHLTGWAPAALGALAGWATSVGQVWDKWITDTKTNIANWATNTLDTVKNWSTNTWNNIKTWATNTGTSISTWVSSVGKSFEQWKTTVSTVVSTWAATTWDNIKKWVTDTTSSISKWSTDTWNNIKTWATNTTKSIGDWSTTTIAAIGKWIETTKQNWTQWATTTKANFDKWAEGVKTTVKNWASATWKSFGDWIGSVGKNLDNWARTTSKNFNSWAKTVGEVWGNWIEGTSAGAVKWVKNVSGNINEWASATSKTVNSWARSAWGSFKDFLNGSASGVWEWAKGTFNTIATWAQSVWGKIKELANAAGEAITGFSGAARDNITAAGNAIGAWVGEHKTEIAVTAVAAGVIAGAIALAPYTGGWSLGLLALETGGIVDQDQLVRIGEGNKREAVIPLENSTYMRPFSAAVANDLASMLGERSGGQRQTDNGGVRPILYVGTLIADDRSLKELQRKMDIIRVQEEQRKGG